MCIRQAAPHEARQHWVGPLWLAIAPYQVVPGKEGQIVNDRMSHFTATAAEAFASCQLHFTAAISWACGWWAIAHLKQFSPQSKTHVQMSGV
jgi:hypothetical protein